LIQPARAAIDELPERQKLAVIERLASGIAHDCNNAFQNIVASMELVRKLVASGRGPESERFVASAMSSAQRASTLMQLWSGFAGAAPRAPRVVATRDAIASLGELFRRSLPNATGAELDVAADLWSVFCDPNQLQTAVLAMAIHARDASPDGKPIVIGARNVILEDADSAAWRNGESRFVALSVTYAGRSDATSRDAFAAREDREESERTAAIDLSFVRCFARLSGGDASLRMSGNSDADRATTVALFLPRHGDGADQEA
jgi:signal transduction histidine kinase